MRRRWLVAGLIGAALIAAAAAEVLASSGPSAPHPRVAVSVGARVRRPRRTDVAAQLAAVRRLAGRGLPLFCGGGGRRLVALTFDDGPGPYTRLVIRKLRQHHVVATFFIVGKQIRAYPRLARAEVAVAAIGDHTMTHPFLPALRRAEIASQLAGAKQLIQRATRKPVVLFRPPYEGRNRLVDAAARRLGMLEVLWDVDSADSLGANYAGIERNVIAGLRPGAIVLMHENRGQTVRALARIFSALRRDRLRAVTVPELVAEDPPTPRQLRAGDRGCGVRLRRGRD